MDFTPLRIRLPFGSEDEFIARYGVHVGKDGFFLATRAPKALGTQLAFELVLADGTPLLSGEGVVARTVSGTRSGMVVRFLRLDSAGTALVERIVAARPGPTPPASPAAPPGLAARTRSSQEATWPGDPTRDVARVTGPSGQPRPPKAAPAPAPVAPAQPAEVDDRPSSDLAVPLDKAGTWPGDPTRDLARIAARDEVEPKRAAPSPTAAQPTAAPPTAAPPTAAQPAPPPAPPLPDIPMALRPTPAVGVPQAHVHTAVTPVRGIPALGPEVVAFLSGLPPARAGQPPPAARPPALAAEGPPPSAPLPGDETSGRRTTEVPLPGEAVPPGTPTAVPEVRGSGFRTPLRASEPAPPATVAGAPAGPVSPPPVLEAAPPLASEGLAATVVKAAPRAAAEATPPPQVEGRPQSAARVEAIPLPAPHTVARPLRPPAPPPSAPAGGAAAASEAPSVEARKSNAAAPAPADATVPGATPVTAAALPAAVLGLALGTSAARVAWAHDGRVDLLPVDAEGTLFSLPCRLVRDAHGVLRVLQPGEPEEALWVGSPLTLLGTQADSPAIRTLVRRWPVPVVADERGEVAFGWSGVTVTAVELVATLLRSLRASAERRTGKACTQAVLVVPAAFTLLQRARFREAAERAGLTVLRLLHAPTAAALAFAQDKGMARRRVLVWRMGAATCDAEVIAISGNDMDVVSSGGDGSLGGVNFDEQLALALDKTARTDAARLRMRVAQAERCKQALSTSERALVPPASDGEPVIEVTRADLELRTAALVERSVLLAQDVLRAGGLSPENLDALVLSGGMAHLPHLRRAVETAFGKTAVPETDADAAPALGAALLGAALSTPSASGRARSKVVEVLAVPLEAVAPEFGHQRVLERNTRLPAEKTLSLTLPAGQPLEVQLFQGLARAPDPRSFLGLLHAAGVERAGEWTLHLALTADGLLQAAVTPPGGKRRPLLLQAAPPPSEAAPTGEASTEEGDPGARLLGGLKRLFGRR
jgi:molecular chaperone DnaK